MSMGGGSLGTATFYITGNAQGAVNAATQANNALAQMGQTVANNWYGLQTLGRAFSALPAAVGLGVGAAINAAIKWEDAMFQVERTTNTSGEALAGIEQQILDVAKRIPIATTEIANLVSQGAQLGIADDALGEFAETMGIFISATDVGAAGVADFARLANVMQLPNEDMDRLANTVLEVGRNTAATESEILNISKRMSGVAASAGFTADEVVGLGAALISLGPRAEAGATAMNKTITDMTRAVSQGGDELEIFGQVAGMTGAEFAQAFRTDASEAVQSFVTGLARLEGGGEAAIAALDALGIRESRQASALIQLAQGTLDAGNAQRDLNTIMDDSAGYFQRSNATQDIAAKQAKTLSGQLQLLRNAMFELGAIIGGVMVGPLGFMVQRFMDFIAGLQNAPMPIKVLILGLGALLTALSGIAAIALAVGPRLIMAAAALREMRAGSNQLNPSLAILQRQLNNTTIAANRMGGAVQVAGVKAAASSRLIASSAARGAGVSVGSAAAGATANTAVAASALATSASKAAPAVSNLAKWGGRLAKVGGWATLALTGLTIATTFLGHKQREAADAAADAYKANMFLVAIMRQQDAVIGPASTRWLEASAKYKVAEAAAIELGVAVDLLNRIIQGTATGKDMETFVNAIKRGGEQGRIMGQNVLELGKSWAASADRAGIATKATGDFADSQYEAAEATQEQNDALQEQHDLLEGVAQAHLDLADAVVSQDEAWAALEDAQREYAEALADAANPAERLLAAEQDLADARSTHQDALRKLEDLEEDLSEARAKGAQNAREAELDLKDAEDQLIDSYYTITDLEAELAELRSGGSVDELRDATNDLRSAELRLARAHQTVADAEWYLQHLREEGASGRDIQEAEMAIAEARHETAEAEDELIDATRELAELRDPTAQARRIQELERDIAKAYRDSERASYDLLKAQENLTDARERVAQDRDYIEAQEAIVDQHRAIRDSLDAVRESEEALRDLQTGGLQREVAEASRNLESAILDVAKANVEVQKQQALANGLTWDAGDAARALSTELGKLINLAPDAAAQQRLRDYIDIINRAPNVPDAPKPGGAGDFDFDPNMLGLPSMDDLGGYFDTLEEEMEYQLGNLDPEPKDNRSLWDKIWEGIGGGAGAGAGVGGILGAILGGPPGAILGSAAGALIGGLTEKFWPQIKANFAAGWWSVTDAFGRFQEWFTGLDDTLLGWSETAWGKLSDIGGAIWDGIWSGFTAAFDLFEGWGRWIGDNIIDPFKSWLGIDSPSTVFMEIGGWIMEGLLKGLGGGVLGVLGFFIGLPARILGLLGTAGSWLIGIGGQVVNGLKNGASWAWDQTKGVREWFGRIPTNVRNAVDTAKDGGVSVLKSIGNGLLRGLGIGGEEGRTSFLIPLINRTKGSILNPFSNPRGLLNGVGQWITYGLAEGLAARAGDVYSVITGIVNNVRGAFDIFNFGSPSKLTNQFGQWIMMGLENGLISQQQGVVNAVRDTADMIQDEFARDYVAALMVDPSVGRAAFAASAAGIGQGGGAGTNVTYNENLNLEAITTADPAEIVNEYVWQKRVRLRGGVR